MHARLELPSVISQGRSWSCASQTGRRRTVRSRRTDGSGSTVVGAAFLRKSIFAQCCRPRQVAAQMHANTRFLSRDFACKSVEARSSGAL